MRRFPENPIRKLLDYVESRGDLTPHERERVLKEFLGVPAHTRLSDPDSGLVIKITTEGQAAPEVIRLSELVRLWVSALYVADSPGVGEQLRLVLNQLASESITLAEAVSLIVPLVVAALEQVSVNSTGVTLQTSGVRVEDNAWLAESVRLLLVSFVSASDSVSLTETVQLLILAAAVEASESVSVDSSGVALLRNLFLQESVLAEVSELLHLVTPPQRVLLAAQDAQVADGVRADTNYGDFIQSWIGYEDENLFNSRYLVQFDLSGIPALTPILWAKLQLMPTEGTTPSGPFTIHQVTASWNGATVTWNTQPTFDASEVGAVSIPELFAVTDVDLKTLVQGWVDGTEDNYGVLLKGTDSQVPPGRVATLEWEMNQAWRPRLWVAYGETLSVWNREPKTRMAETTTLELIPIGTPQSLGLASDTYVANGSQSSQNFQGSTGLLVGYTPGGFAGRAAFAVDLSALPEGAVVTNARLEAYCYGSFMPTALSIEARCWTGAWNVATLTWANQPGNVFLGSQSVEVGEVGWYTWDVTAEVNHWQTFGLPNNGLCLMAPTDGGPGKWFYSLDYANPAFRPQLNVTYHT